jgi:predicted CxxxxCH...CXXCH cytochrome family protein
VTRVGVGAHRTHLRDGPLHKAYPCETCHLVPATPEAPGHYQTADGQRDEQPAEVALAPGPRGVASWNREEATCTNTACHAPAADARATRQAPRWNKVGQGEAACGSCHGLPPASHADDRCQTCHRPAYDAAGALRPEVHANGTVDLSAEANACTGCHGGEGGSAAPPRDLAGRGDERLRTVGAHRAHLEGRHKLSAPVACAECHKVPATLKDEGHIDSAGPAELFPDVPGVGARARAGGTVASYDAAAGTCTTYCHGGGKLLGMDMSAGLVQRPSWTGGSAEAVCGTCHGIPPRLPGSPSHNGVTLLSQCVNCHPQTVLPGGGIRVERDAQGNLTSTHIDGIIQYHPPQ